MPTIPPTHQPALLLHEFLRSEHEAILAEWERLERQLLASTRQLSHEDLRNNIPAILKSLADNAELAEAENRTVDIPSEGPKGHAQHRWRLGFSLEEVTREYGLLRTVILQKLVTRIGELRAGELVLLNEWLDHAIIQSVITFVAKSNKALETEQERLQVTLKSISDAVISTDVDGRITYFNPAAERISGWSQEEALGRPVAEVFITAREVSSQTLKSLNRGGKLPGHANEKLLQHCVRQSDTVSRLGSDEFAILLVDFEPLSYLGELSHKLANHLRAPYVLGPDTIEVSTSIGISVFPEDGGDAETLIKNADAAMYEAKASGRDNVRFFAPEMIRRTAERFRLEADLRKAIAENQL